MAGIKILDIKNPLKDSTFLFILCFGLIFRIILAVLPGFKIDVDAWFAWALRIYEVGLPSFYSSQIWTNYTPGFLYILWVFGFLKDLLSINDNLFYFLLKTPSIFAELILGVLIYNISFHHSPKKIALFSSALVLLNPALIFNSSVWGQIDGLLTLFMVLSIFYLLKKNFILSSIFFCIALLIKPQALAIAPILFLYLIKNFSVKTFLKLIIPSILLFFVLTTPFFPSQPLTGIFSLISQMVDDYSYTSLFAYNIWGLIGFWINDSQTFILSFKDWGLLLLAAYWTFISFLFFKKNLGLFTAAALATLAFYFLPTRVHERYLYPSLVFLVLSSIEYRNYKILLVQIGLSLLYFLNLYYVYIYYNELFLKLPKVLYMEFFYKPLDNFPKIFSLISTIIFIMINFLILKKILKTRVNTQDV